jgi:hypothetical protein
MANRNAIELRSYIAGILTAVIVAGAFDVFFYYFRSKVYSESVTDLYSALFALVSIILVVVIAYFIIRFILERRPNKRLFDQKGKSDKDKDASVLTYDEIRYSILKALYKKAETNPHNSGVSEKELIEILNVDEKTLQFNLIYLEQEKLIETLNLITINNKTFGPKRITSPGINVIEHKEENKNRFPFLTAIIPVQIETKIGLINLNL